MNSPVNVSNPGGTHQIVLVCEHASAYIPAQYNQLGLSAEDASSHIAWDPGALVTATHLADKMNAVLVEGTVSRLIYDLNRPPEAPSAMAESSEGRVVPGNIGLSATERQHRTDTFYSPFTETLHKVLSQHPVPPVVVTMHSFTPVYNGLKREVEIGILHDTDTRLADAVLDCAVGYKIQRNQPYGPDDGVTHTLKQHCLPAGYLNCMVEIRNTLIATNDQCAAMAGSLQTWLDQALVSLQTEPAIGTQS